MSLKIFQSYFRGFNEVFGNGALSFCSYELPFFQTHVHTACREKSPPRMFSAFIAFINGKYAKKNIQNKKRTKK